MQDNKNSLIDIKIKEKWKQIEELAVDIANLSQDNKNSSDYKSAMKLWKELYQEDE